MTATWPALDEMETALAAATPGPWEFHNCPNMLLVDSAAIVAAVNLAPKLIAAMRAVIELCDEAAAEIPHAYPPMWVEDVREALAAALGDPQPDTRQCPATRDDGYRCQAFTAHDKHVDSLGRQWT